MYWLCATLVHSPFAPPFPLHMCYNVWTTENWLETIEQTSWGTSGSGPSSSCWPANQTLWWLTRSRKGQPQQTRQSQVIGKASEKSAKDPEISKTDWATGNNGSKWSLEVRPVTLHLWQIPGPTSEVFVKKDAVQTLRRIERLGWFPLLVCIYTHQHPHQWQALHATIPSMHNNTQHKQSGCCQILVNLEWGISYKRSPSFIHINKWSSHGGSNEMSCTWVMFSHSTH